MLTFEPAALREAVRGTRDDSERLFACATLAGSAALHLAHRRLLAAVHVGDAIQVQETALHLLQLSTDGGAHEWRPDGPAARRAAALAADAQVVIAGAFTGRVTLEGLASKLGVSVFRLCRTFRQVTGGTLHQHLTCLRLALALEWLPRYRERLTDLALDLGFSSHSHFTHAFRTYFGRAPSVLLHSV